MLLPVPRSMYPWKMRTRMSPRKLLVFAAMNSKQLYRMRAPASGREAIAPAEPGQIYRDRETGEEMFPVAMVLPLAPSTSSLPRSPENLRACRRCDQLIGIDVSDCPYCGLRPGAVERRHVGGQRRSAARHG